jgi:hypothetical protein
MRRCTVTHKHTHSQQNWVNNPGGSRYEDKIGAILSRGADLKATFKQQALGTAAHERSLEKLQTEPAAAFLTAIGGAESANGTVDMRGYTWVSEHGETIAPATTERFFELPPAPSAIEQLASDRQRSMAAMTATQRSMHLWNRVNPG